MNENAFAAQSTIALCTDTHFWPGAPNYVATDGTTQLQGATERIQRTLLNSIRQQNPDIVLHLGDWSCGGGSFNMPVEAFYQVQQATKAAFCELPSPVYALPGNHDCPPSGDYTFFAKLWDTEVGCGHTIDLPAARVVLLNTHGHTQEQLADSYPGDPISGWVNPAELQRLENALATADGRPVLLFLHQLLMPWQGEKPWRDLYGVDNGDEVLNIVAHYGNVRAVIQGHAHMLNVHTRAIGTKPCTFVVSPAVIEYPMAWLLLKLTMESIAVQVQRLPLPDLAQVSRLSGPGQTWREGRREWQNFTISLK